MPNLTDRLHINIPVDLGSPIGQKYQSLGGTAFTGEALAVPESLPTGFSYQRFANGTIFYSPAFGAVWVLKVLFDKWSNCASLTTSSGDRVQDYLGAPIADAFQTAEHEPANRWERGLIVARKSGAFVVYGAIYLRYQSLGDLSVSNRQPLVGLPTSDEQAAAKNGRYSRFDTGDIYWRADLGAWEMNGAIRDRWLAMGGAGGSLGYPVSGESEVSNGKTVVGRFSQFELNAAIYHSPQTGAWDLRGAIWECWRNLGGATGAMGFPTSGESDTPARTALYNDFRGGVIVYHKAGPHAGAFAVTNLELSLNRFSNPQNEDFFVVGNATVSDGQHKALIYPPEAASFASGTIPKQLSSPHVLGDPPIFTLQGGGINGRLVIDIDLAMWHGVSGGAERPISNLQVIGEVKQQLSSDNLWNLGEQTVFNRQFTLNYSVKSNQPYSRSPDAYRTTVFWPFENKSLANLSKDLCAETYQDVSIGDLGIDLNIFDDFSFHPLMVAFYELVYKKAGQGGLCFGMCVESIYALLDRSPFSEPIYSNPLNPYRKDGTQYDPVNPGNDASVVELIEVRQGYEYGAEFLSWAVGLLDQGAWNDPVRCFNESRADFQSGGHPIITLSNNSALDQSGHVVVPFKWEPDKELTWPDHTRDSSIATIYVCDPNKPGDPMSASTSKLTIDAQTNSFSYPFGTNDTWTGGSGFGGRSYSIPFKFLSYVPTSPTDLVSDLSLGMGFLINWVNGGGGGTNQITDNSGRTFFRYVDAVKPGQPLAKTKTINLDTKTRIPSFMPVLDNSLVAGPVLHRPAPAPAQSTVEAWVMRREPPVPKTGAPAASASLGDVFKSAVGDRTGLAEIALAPETLAFEVWADAGAQRAWAAGTPRMTASVSLTSTGAHADTITIAAPGLAEQTVSFTASPDNPAPTIRLTVGGPALGAATVRWFDLRNLTLAPGHSFAAQVDNGGQELLLHNGGGVVSFELRACVGARATAAVRPSVKVDAGVSVRIKPLEWAALGQSPVRMFVLDAPGGKVIRQLDL